MPDIVQFLLRFILFALLHSILALPSFKERVVAYSHHAGKFYRLYYNLISLVSFGWVMAAYNNSTVLFVVPGIWSLFLYLLQLIFLLILISCVKQTGLAEFLGIARGDSGTEQLPKLITSGWYQLVRHPLYLFSTLFLISNPIISVRSLILTLVAVAYFVFGARLEENRLVEEYGDEYLDYQERVPFMLPEFIYRKS